MTLENVGVIATPTNRRKSEEEISALEHVKKSITIVGKHYEIESSISPSLINASNVPKDKYRKSKWRTNITNKS
jgi:hypothetical protein